MSKEVLCIHEITPEILNIPKEVLESYTLTFDDGLYSQFYHWKHFKDLNTEKIFFITPKMVNRNTKSEQIVDIPCKYAYDQYITYKNPSAYSTLDQIKQLRKDGAIIGGHSYHHFKEKHLIRILPQTGYLKEKFNYIVKDTEKMIEWFEIHLDQKVDYFCYPFNNTYNGLYTSIITKMFKIDKVYGEERVLIESLL